MTSENENRYLRLLSAYKSAHPASTAAAAQKKANTIWKSVKKDPSAVEEKITELKREAAKSEAKLTLFWNSLPVKRKRTEGNRVESSSTLVEVIDCEAREPEEEPRAEVRLQITSACTSHFYD